MTRCNQRLVQARTADVRRHKMYIGKEPAVLPLGIHLRLDDDPIRSLDDLLDVGLRSKTFFPLSAARFPRVDIQESQPAVNPAMTAQVEIDINCVAIDNSRDLGPVCVCRFYWVMSAQGRFSLRARNQKYGSLCEPVDAPPSLHEHRSQLPARSCHQRCPLSSLYTGCAIGVLGAAIGREPV